ncbi:hypothetical protein BpHYR1_038374 [Brachionus plicatilis]|uniref:Uncharacterized protein n=1 Tax=Brachionus plicatilis TaxID=10195 RepID=A0A3M7R1C4_BRAPC|nr:hypothetical protein BpHYR1_038374 [Brachionus plicatilis]
MSEVLTPGCSSLSSIDNRRLRTKCERKLVFTKHCLRSWTAFFESGKSMTISKSRLIRHWA